MSLPANDLLSPYHDGELTAAERAIVEQQLATNPDARRELSEIRQVSALLKSLDRQSLPSEFPQQVLQGIEREMLIPTDCPRHDDSVAASATWKRSWSVGTAAVLTSAAALLLLVRAVDHDRAPRSGMQVASERSESDDAVGFRGPVPLAATAAKENSVPAADRAEAKALAGAAGGNAVAPGVNRGITNLYLDQSALRAAEIGDVVEALQTDGSDVAVVRLTVVDRQEGLQALQVLLTKNRIAPEAESIPNKKSDLSRRDADSDGPEQMLAVFVESDSEHLAAALRELRETKFVQSLEVESPISLAQLDDAENKPAEASEKLKRFGSSTRALPTETLDRKSGDKPPALSKSPTTAEVAKDARGLARQFSLQLSANALPQAQNESKSRARANVAQRGQTQSRFKREDLAEQRQLSEQRPMQVLFVVVDQSATGKPPSPTAAPKSAAPAKTTTKPAQPQEQDGAA